MEDKIVGFKCTMDGTGCEGLTEKEADQIWAHPEEVEKRRKELMPTQHDALKAMQEAYIRLKELGWSEAIYCPKDGSHFDVIENGSTGTHDCYYDGEWPNGSWWVCTEGDIWPSRPCLYKLQKPRLTQDIFKGQPDNVVVACVDYDGMLKFGDDREIRHTYTYASERWRGSEWISKVEGTDYEPLTRLERNANSPKDKQL